MRLFSLRILLNKIPGARLVGSWLGERRYRRWKRHNPEGDFSQFYVDHVLSATEKGKGHPTLGTRGFTKTKPGAVAWTPESFAQRGCEQWSYYSRVTNLTRHGKCVDFGCGSLRVGQHAIRQLERGCYWGLDVTDAFITSGLQLIDPSIISQKQPHFSVIEDSSIEQVRAWKPDAIFANAVLQHVPPPELPTFFRRIGRLLAPGAIAAIVFIADSSITQVKAMSWAYPDDVLTSAVLESDRKLKARCFPLDPEGANAFAPGRRLLKIERSA
jgi:SAM-dependent methyltransferase